MLVLSRKPGEKVRIGSEITLVVLELRRNRVRIGIDAPSQVPIARQELCDLLVRPLVREKSEARGMHHAAGHP
jgi:carbon storage regulator